MNFTLNPDEAVDPGDVLPLPPLLAVDPCAEPGWLWPWLG